jgi:hypothetical protein
MPNNVPQGIDVVKAERELLKNVMELLKTWADSQRDIVTKEIHSDIKTKIDRNDELWKTIAAADAAGS